MLRFFSLCGQLKGGPPIRLLNEPSPKSNRNERRKVK